MQHGAKKSRMAEEMVPKFLGRRKNLVSVGEKTLSLWK